MKRGLFLLLALSLGLNAGLLYVRYADRPMRRSEHPGPPHAERLGPPPGPDMVIRDHLQGISRHLDLSRDQRQAIRVILEQNMPVMTDLLRQSTEANRQISESFAAADFDEQQFRMRVNQASLLRARADSVSAVMLLGEAAVLTPQQRVKYAEVAPTVYSNPKRRPSPPRKRP